jgi:hypothetical protein
MVVTAVDALVKQRSGTLERILSVFRPDWPDPRPVVVSLVDGSATPDPGAQA